MKIRLPAQAAAGGHGGWGQFEAALMTMPRMVGLLVGLAAIGVAVVALRLDQAQHLREIAEAAVRSGRSCAATIWSQEMELARLRSPQMVRERAARFDARGEPGSAGGW